MATIGSLSVKLGLDPDRFRSGMARAGKSLKAFQDDIDRSSRNVATLGKALTILSAAPALAILGGAAISASGAILALPAAVGVAGAAFAVLKMGTSGLGDALSALAEGDAKAAQEALAKLSPSARAAALAMNGVREQFRAVQQTVQQNLFAGLAPSITALGNTYLPILDKGLGSVSTSMNGMAQAAIKAAGTPFMQGAVRDILAGTARVMTTLQPAVASLVTVLGALIRGGMPLIQMFANWITPLLGSAAAFLSSADGAAWMQQKITEAKAGLALIGAVVGSLWKVLVTLGTALQVVSRWFQSLPGPVQSVLGQMMAWGLVVGVVTMKLAPLVVAIARIAPALIRAGVAVSGFIAKMALMTARLAITAAAWVAKWTLMAVQALARAAMMAAAWIIAMGPIGWIIAAVVALVALIILNWDKVKAFTIAAWSAVSSFISGVWKSIVGAVTSAANAVVNFLRSAWNRAKSLARSAWSAIANAVRNGASRVIGFVRSLPGRILSALGNLGSLLVNAGRNVIRGLINGIRSMIGAVAGAIGNVVSTIRSYLPFSPAKKGPLAGKGAPDRGGANIAHMIAAGIDSGQPAVAGAMAGIVDTVASAVAGIEGLVSGGGLAIGRSPMQRAAAEMLEHVRGGGQFFEDFSFRGSSDLVGRFNDKLAAQFHRANPGEFNRGQVEQFLAGQAAVRDTGSARQQPVTVNFEGGTDNAVATLIMQLVRSGKIQLQA